MQRLLTLAFACACITSLQAKEHTVTENPFHISTSLDAGFLPSSSTAISIQPEAWTDFTITSVVPQGTVVKKGDTLIAFETKQLDKNITEAEQARASAALTLAQAKHDLAQLELSTPRSLANHERSEKETTENLAWYTETGHPNEIEATKRSVKKAEFALAYQQEELKQLLKMYAEDEKTEETEEIILKRTRNYVEQAEFTLKTVKIQAEHALKTEIPRKLKSMKLAAEEARIANAAAKEKLPRELKLKQLEVAKAIRDDAKSAENLTQLKADRAAMNITAPADGVVYYGSMDKGKWDPAAAAKVLKTGGKAPAQTTLLTFIPNDTALSLHAFVKEADLSALAPEAKGFATTSLNPYQNIPVSVTKLTSHPGIDGFYQIELKPTLTKDTKVVPGMMAKVTITSQHIEKAITIPTEFLIQQADGSYTVKVKLADGKTEERPVIPGASKKSTVVITKGLEKGQVIVR